MKQTAAVIAALFATVHADVDAHKAAFERDIHAYLENGLEFDKKFVKAVGGDVHRVAVARAKFNEEARENWAEGHKVMDDYVEAIKYEKSQEVVTKPTKANGWWGNIHYNNPQKIMDKWADAIEADHELGEEWEDDFGEYMERVHESH
jgi:hypothetical protein